MVFYHGKYGAIALCMSRFFYTGDCPSITQVVCLSFTLTWNSFWRIPSQGGPQDYGEENSARKGWCMGISPAGGRDGRGRTVIGEDLRFPSPQHSCTVYWNQPHYGPVSGGGSEDGGKGDQAVVVSVQMGCGVDVDGGLGGGIDVGGGGYRRDKDGYRDRLSQWEDNVAHVALGTKPNSPVAYALVLEHHHPIMSTISYPGVRLER